jgi:hypothetical protein
MIETKKIFDDPIIIQHKVFSFPNPQETIKDVKVAVEVIKKSIQNKDAFNLLLDFTGPEDKSNYDRAAHKEWAIGFKENDEINKYVQKVAVLARDTPMVRAEKECMEDNKHRWFTDYDEAMGWLKAHITK